MRTLFVIAALAAVAFMAGWFTVSRDTEHTTIQFNREEIRDDARQAIEKGREFLGDEASSRAEPPGIPWGAAAE
jgi:hypothetical protein